jgi:hypothetical protein
VHNLVPNITKHVQHKILYVDFPACAVGGHGGDGWGKDNEHPTFAQMIEGAMVSF